MRILISDSGGVSARAVLSDLRSIGLQGRNEVFIVTHSWLSTLPDHDANVAVFDLADQIRKEFSEWSVSTQSTNQSPVAGILAKKDRFRPDLIILGDLRHEQDHIFNNLGNTNCEVLKAVDCSVRIARRRGETVPKTEKLLIGFDGSSGSIKAIKTIATRNYPTGARARLLAIADSSVLGTIGRFTPQMMDAAIEARFAAQWARTLAASSLAQLMKAGVVGSVEVEFGDPKDEIVKKAEAWNADVIFLGSHGPTSSFGRFMHSSMSTEIATHANCSVEIVRADHKV